MRTSIRWDRWIGIGALVLVAIFVVALLIPAINPAMHGGPQSHLKVEIITLGIAIEDFRLKAADGLYPPSSNDDPEEMRQFLAKVFPKYHGGLPEKYKKLDAASSLVFWLGGMTNEKGEPIGFSADPTNPFDAKSPNRYPAVFSFDPARLRIRDGLLVYLPPNGKTDSDPYVYFRPDAKGEYHGGWGKCAPCRDSRNGKWRNPKGYQLFSPGKDGKYGSGVQYPSGADYDAQRKDDMSSFSAGTLGDDMDMP